MHRAVRSYRERMHEYAAMGALAVFYSRVDVAAVMDFVSRRAHPFLESTVKSATRHDALADLAKLTEVVESVPAPHRPPAAHLPPREDQGLDDGDRRRGRLPGHPPGDRRNLLDRFEVKDVAVKVVGVGSVGLLALVVLLEQPATGEPLFLQVKQAEASVLESYLGRVPSSSMASGWWPAASAPGCQRRPPWLDDRPSRPPVLCPPAPGPEGQCGDRRDDRRRSPNVGQPLRLDARPRSRPVRGTGDDRAYLGGDDAIDHAIAEIAVAYADQTEEDFVAFTKAIDRSPAGRLPGERTLSRQV